MAETGTQRFVICQQTKLPAFKSKSEEADSKIGAK